MKAVGSVRRLIGLALTVALAGCGGSGNPTTYPVSGVVLQNGKGVANVNVAFFPESGPSASGRTDADGKFTLTTFETGDGAVAGEQKVAITPVSQVASDPNADVITDAKTYAIAKPKDLPIPAKYVDPGTSGLRVKVPDDTQSGEIKLELK